MRAYKSFLAEVAVMMNTDHLNIITFYKSFRDYKGDLYIIMEFCDGGDLYNWRNNNIGKDDLLEENLIIDILW